MRIFINTLEFVIISPGILIACVYYCMCVYVCVFVQVAGIQLNTPDRLNRANMSGIFVEGPAINATHLSSRLLIFVNDDLSDVDNSRNNTGVKCIAEGETVFDSVQSDEVFLITFCEFMLSWVDCVVFNCASRSGIDHLPLSVM